MRVLVTGGAGYIGSHTCVAPLEADHDITVNDNLCNSSEVALGRSIKMLGKKMGRKAMMEMLPLQAGACRLRRRMCRA